MSKYLRQYIPKNKSGGLITLSISESLLLLSDAHTQSISSDAPHVNGFIAYLKTSKPKQLVLIEGHSGDFSIQRKPSDVRYGGLFFGDKLHPEPSSSINSDFSLVS